METRRRCFVWMLVLLAIVAVMAPVASAEPQLPVRLRIEPLSIRGRSGGPIPMQFKLEYNQPGILEGDLFLEIYNSLQMSSDLMATIRYEGIVLQGQDYFFQTTLPPLRHSTTKQYLVVGWFETDQGRIPLTADPDRLDPPEPHELLTIGDLERATLICSASGQSDYLKPSPAMKYLNSALSLENFNPAGKSNSTEQSAAPLPHQRVLNHTTAWDALNLPSDPLALTSFDLVLLGDGALSRLQNSQMKALLTWLDAGGSLCVCPNKDRLGEPQLKFLRTIFSPAESETVGLSSTDDGRLMVISDTDNPIVNVRYGLGRATLLPGDSQLQKQLTGKALGSVVAHLWKVRWNSPIAQGRPWASSDLTVLLKRQGLVLHEVDGGFQVLPRGMQPGTDGANRQGMGWSPRRGQYYTYSSLSDVQQAYSLQTDLTPKQSFAVSACESALLPEGVSVVPTSIIAGLLLAYVVVIGPVDYVVLGFLRLRKLTWILFPVVTAAFTWLTLAVAGSYMATTDTGGQLVITDVIEGGRAVRETEIQMQFQGSQKTLTEEKTSEFVVPLSIARPTIDPRTRQMVPPKVDVRLHYSGRFPQKYQTTQQLSQWKPMLTRSLRLNPSSERVPDIPWDDEDLITTGDGRQQLRRLLQKLQTEKRQVDAVVLHGQRQFPILGADAFLFSPTIIQEVGTLAEQFRVEQQWVMRGRNLQGHDGRLPREQLLALAVIETARSQGTRTFASIASRVAPHGAATLEDLPLLDTDHPNEWLLMVAVREGGRTHIFRRLYTLNPSVSVESLSDPENMAGQSSAGDSTMDSLASNTRPHRAGIQREESR